jgi:hypothetical protein
MNASEHRQPTAAEERTIPVEGKRDALPMQEIRKGRIILAEGKDDSLLMGQICKQEGLADAIQVHCYSQVGKLTTFLDGFVRRPDFGKVVRIGLTRDSDEGAERALQSLQHAWVRASQTLTGIDRSPPQASFFALPDNQTKGRIENLCLEAPAFPDILACAERMYECAVAVDPQPDAIDREKSIVAAYLSMMHRPGLELGTGAEAGCWNLNSPVFSPLREFIRSIAG